MEKAIANSLTAFVEKLELLSPIQFGFRKQHSTEMALIKIQDNITKDIEVGYEGQFTAKTKEFWELLSSEQMNSWKMSHREQRNS